MKVAEKIEERFTKEQGRFTGYRDDRHQVVKKEVADANGWRKVTNGKPKPTVKYWKHRRKALTTLFQEELDAEKAEAKQLAEAVKQEKLAKKELAKEKQSQGLEEKQNKLEKLRSKLRAEGVAEEELPTKLPRSKDYGECNGLQSPYGQDRRSGYLCIWLVLSKTPDKWVSWEKVEKEALAIFQDKWPEYLATHYGNGNEYDFRVQVGVMDRSPYNKPVEAVGQRVIKSRSKGVMLISDTKGESYADYKVRIAAERTEVPTVKKVKKTENA